MIKLLDFYMDTCMPCKTLKPILEQVAETTEVEFINARENVEMSAKYGIRKVPTVIILKDGEEVDRFTGIKSKQEIEDLINK